MTTFLVVLEIFYFGHFKNFLCMYACMYVPQAHHASAVTAIVERQTHRITDSTGRSIYASFASIGGHKHKTLLFTMA